MALTERERDEVAAANDGDRRAVVFVHGLWMLAGSWDAWRARFEEGGWATVAIDWPGDPADRADALRRPEAVADQSVGQVVDHVVEVLAALARPPVLVGHSVGGTVAQIVGGKALAAGTVAIAPAPFRWVLPLPFSTFKAALPVLGRVRNHSRAVMLTRRQFGFAFANALSESETDELYETWCVPAPGRPLFQCALANVNWRTEVKVDTKQPQRGPLLIIAGQKDNLVPWSLTKAAQKRYRLVPARITELANRGHSLCIDSGWEEVAETASAFLAGHDL